ncbi:AT-rich interactive domain-containing protein 5 [Ricinus communis]|uniref:Transcription factor, putative n=1 Tax=Ricinus communis TaxID=3988 RepID=B9R8U2_RICCO|nr:AT-rich interactive domain-containing protein 5 [Ricinus communis]EEF52922.1 transcription factor, putative [Ricinus communis]|eukprot:XP_002510735.1 AT-rich interactive domain-containing protein 5 [Ricinus communis]
MEDAEMPSQDLPAGTTDVSLVDGVVSTEQPKENERNPSENGNTPAASSEGDKTDTLPSDVYMSENQVLPESKTTTTATTGTNVNDANSIKVRESKDDGDGGTIVHDQPEALAVTPLAPRKYSTPRAKHESGAKSKGVWTDVEMGEADESGTPEERAAFMRELETFHKENALEFKPPKFYGEPLNCLKLWRSVIRLGGYEVVTASKLWRQVGESFHPPKTCTTVSWTFRIFYEKALLEYEKHKRQSGELQLPSSPPHQPASVEKEVSGYQAPGSGRARRDAAARAMQGWHAQRLLGHGEVSEPIIKDRSVNSAPRREKPLKSIGLHKQKNNLELAEKHANIETDKELDMEIVDVGPPADWVKINVRESKDCFEVYALVPGLLREEVRVQSDPAGRLVITGQPEQLDNPWGITPFKKVISLPSRIDPLQTSAVVSLHGRLYVRVPFERGSA